MNDASNEAPANDAPADDFEQHILHNVHTWVWSGFYLDAEVHVMADELLEEDPTAQADEDAIHAAIDAGFAAKADAEASWPPETDCDRLDRVFRELDGLGICAVHNAGWTMSDGFADVAEALDERGRDNYHGYCFYHGQDLERAVAGQGLSLAFGSTDERAGAPAQQAVGNAVKACCERAGFAVAWDGSSEGRIELPRIDWKRRFGTGALL